MTLKIFENELRKRCQIAFKNLIDGKRKLKLQKRRERIYSMTDVIKKDKKVGKTELHYSCIKTFGNILEKTAMDYAKMMGKVTYPRKNFLSIKIDIVFRINKKVYNLESKSNIELDAGKTKKALETLQRKHKTVFNALDCHNEGWQVISKFVVWTKATSRDANETAKKPIEEKHLMGFKDFFNLFNININTDKFFGMLQKVYHEEVEAYF